MRRIWIIAWRGFVEHATSRPFLLGVMLPLFYLLLVGYVPNASQSQLALLGSPVRDFAIIAAASIYPAFVGGRRRALRLKQVGESLAGADVHSASRKGMGVARNADSTTIPSRRLTTSTSA
jgi:hypothetical protein